MKSNTRETEHVRKTDFQEEPEKSRRRMNKFVENSTNGEIKELFKDGSVNIDTTVVLLNALTVQVRNLKLYCISLKLKSF